MKKRRKNLKIITIMRLTGEKCIIHILRLMHGWHDWYDCAMSTEYASIEMK